MNKKVNTNIGVDLKTIMNDDALLKIDKPYYGELIHDDYDHFVFREMSVRTIVKRNPHVYDGKYITITRREDCSLRLNFKFADKHDVRTYANGVRNEIIKALDGLREE